MVSEKPLWKIINLFLKNLDNKFNLNNLSCIFEIYKRIAFNNFIYTLENVSYMWLNILEESYVPKIYLNNDTNNRYINMVRYKKMLKKKDKFKLFYPFLMNNCINNSRIKIIKMNVSKYKKTFNYNNLIFSQKVWHILKNLIIENKELHFLTYFYSSKTEFKLYKANFKKIRRDWKNVNWVISFKFNTSFTNNNNNLLLSFFKYYIKDDKLIQILKIFFEKKILGLNYFRSISRFNWDESDKLSNLFVNVIFNKLDKKINNLNCNLFESWINYSVLKDNIMINNNFSLNNILDNQFNSEVKIKFVRYFDTFIIGLNSNKLVALEIKNELSYFLKTKLFLNNVYCYLTDIHNDNIKFLNVKLSSGLDRNNQHRIIFLSSRYLILRALINTGILNSKGRPIPMKQLLRYNINTIIHTYINIIYYIISSLYFCQDFNSTYKYIYYSISISLKFTLELKLNKKINNLNKLYKLGLIKQDLYKYFSIFQPKNFNILRIESIYNDFSLYFKDINWETKVNFNSILLKRKILYTQIFSRKPLLNSKIIIINRRFINLIIK